MAKLTLLKSERDFQAFRQSKAYSSALLRIRILSKPDQNTPRFGFIVPKKVLSKVTDRNKVKRRLKTFLLRNEPKIKSADILIFPNRELLKKKYSELELELSDLFSKARLWRS